MASKGKKPGYPARYFSQSNPRGKGMGDIPTLLRRVADTIENLGPDTEIQDIVLHDEFDDQTGKWWPSMTVYFHPAKPR